jgi:hypothetical protein
VPRDTVAQCEGEAPQQRIVRGFYALFHFWSVHEAMLIKPTLLSARPALPAAQCRA